MGITFINPTVPSKWVGVVICGILLYIDLFEKTDAAFQCTSGDPTDCSCVTVTGPADAIVLSNTTISLNCIVTNTNGSEVQWLKGEVALGTDPTIPGEPRYSMTTVNSNYSLIINNVQLSDQSTYRCQVDDCLIQSDPATIITVYVLPSEPEVTYASDDGIVDVVASDSTSIECFTSHAKPSATIGWFNFSDNTRLLSSDISTVDPDGVTQSYSSTFTFTPSIVDNNEVLYCAVGGNAVLLTGQVSLNKVITLNVISKPSIFSLSGATSGSTLTIDLGSSANVVCNATTTESKSYLIWQRNDVEQNSTSYSQQVLDDGSVLLSSTLYIFGGGENSGVAYLCTVISPGVTRSYQENLGFTVAIYEFPLGGVIGGSILGFILIIALIILIICCVRRRKGKETTLADSMPDPLPQQRDVINSATEDEPPVERVESALENAMQQAADSEFDTTSYADTEHTAVEEEAADDTESVNLPDGDVFSLSSSMMRSERGSPVPNDGEMEGENEQYGNEYDDQSSSDDESDNIPSSAPPRRMQTFYV